MIKNYDTAIVTGALHGIGPYIARALAKEGMNLTLAARPGLEIEGIKHDKAEIVVMPGLGWLMKVHMDHFPGMGPMMNRIARLTDLMKCVADFRDQQPEQLGQ